MGYIEFLTGIESGYIRIGGLPLVEGFIQRLQQWPRNVRLFFIANMLYQIGGGMFSVLYNLYIQGLGYSETMNGRIISVQSLVTAIMFIPVGLLGDRLSRKTLLILGACCSGLLFVGRSFWAEGSGMLLLAGVSGLFAAFVQVLAIPFLAESVSKSERLRVFSLYSSIVLASQIIGSLGGGVFADGLQWAGLNHITSLQLVLCVGGIATLLSFIPLLYMSEAPSRGKIVQAAAATEQAVNTVRAPQEQGEASSAPTTQTVQLQRRDQNADGSNDRRIISQFVLTQLLIGFGSGLVIPYLNLYFTNRFNASLSGMSLLIALGQVMTIVSMLIGPYLAARLGSVKAVVCFQVLSLPFLLITGFTNLLWVASISFLFRQALMNAANPIHSSVLIDRVSDRRRGIANSMMQTAFMIGWATMGPVQSYLITTYGTYWGYAITFSITGVLYSVSSLLYYFMFRESRSASPVRPGHS
ncbi:MFS transporter [Paenibacillus massiliensis]|uniref:MFS transporter n=1 Tax=Paenibacillus massiliensis TaxID=225917 RepID=UPI0003AB2722|nr:MFS transporter [Paenibacillus massiliensis]